MSMIFYFPILTAAFSVLAGDFRPEEFGSPLFRALILIWVINGTTCAVLGINLLKRILQGVYKGREIIYYALISALAILMGAPPLYIALELFIKFLHYVGIL
jgi:hypothetical protein